MNNKVIIDTHLIDELILDVLVQACGIDKLNGEDIEEIDNMCLSAYEDACDYLTERGYLQTLNGRIYTINKKDTTFGMWKNQLK
jgi:hypothetical protein